MKKALSMLSALLLCAMLVFSLASCGKKETCTECGEKCSDKYQSTSGSLCKSCYKAFVDFLK